MITAAYIDIHGLVFIPINTKFLKVLIFFSNFRKQGADAITASVDAGWQKRGSGRSYDSLSGMCINLNIYFDYTIICKCCKKLFLQQYFFSLFAHILTGVIMSLWLYVIFFSLYMFMLVQINQN